MESRSSADVLARHAVRLAEAGRLLGALSTYAPESADQVGGQLVRDIDSALTRAAEAIASSASAVIQEREDDQEDFDSSSNIHLLDRLRRRARELIDPSQ